MKTSVDTCLIEIADWYLKNRREMKEPELRAILLKHCESEAEVVKFAKFLETEPGRLRFKTHLRERKGGARAVSKEPSQLRQPEANPYTKSTLPPEVSDILLTHPDSLIDKYNLPKGKGMPRSAEQSKRIVALALKANWGAEQVALTSYHPAWKVVRALEDLMNEEEFSEYRRQKKEFKPVSYLKEEPEPCEIVPSQYHYLLGLLDSVPSTAFLIEPEVKERKIDEILKRLKEGVDSIHQSAVFREFLLTMSKFHAYSIGNQILIMLQRPTATRVAGVKTWNELGRYVRRGEKGIAILAPCLPPKPEEVWVRDKAHWVIRRVPPELRDYGIFSTRNEAGILVMPPVLVERFRTKGEAEGRLREWGAESAEPVMAPQYFKVVYVFDVAQTEGKPLPEIAAPVLTGAFSEDFYNKLLKLAEKQSLTVSFEPRPEQDPEIKGMLFGKTIWVRPEEAEAQRLKTLGHELAHYFTERIFFIPRADAEVIAESVAFVVCAHFGFDTGVRSFPYVAVWAKEKKVLEQNLASIRGISGRIITEVESVPVASLLKGPAGGNRGTGDG